jgi:DsbC/DsbD-like thiol-disulfide interchange protein
MGHAVGAAVNPIHAELIADVQSIQPGKEFTVGVLVRIDDPWHIYWKNPGDSGDATRVEFKLPDGFTAGPLEYPVPERIELPGNIVNFGYMGSVLFMARITPPQKLDAKPVTLSATVSYLFCNPEVCRPGKADVNLALNVSEAASAPANEAVFASQKPRLPIPGDSPQSPATYQVSGQLNGDVDSTFTIRVHWKDAKKFPRR